MLDFSISELAVIAVVALVVIGPERLPKVARTVGTLLGRAQRYVNDVKAEVNREMELEELRKLQTQMQDAARGIKEDVSSAGTEMQSAVNDLEKQLNDGAASVQAAAESVPQFDEQAGLKAPALEGSAAVLPAMEPSHAIPDVAAVESPPPGTPAQISLFPEQTIR